MWATTQKTLAYFAAQFDEAERSGTLMTFTLDSLGLSSSTSFDLIRLDKIGYDFVVRVENDPTVEGFRAVERALHILGIDRDILPAGLYPAQVQTVQVRIDNPKPRRYAVLAEKLRHENSMSEPFDKSADHDVQRGDDAVIGIELVAARADEKFSHGSSSPSVDGGSSPTVGDGPVAGVKEETPVTAGTDTPAGVDTSPLVVHRTASLQDAISARDDVFLRIRNIAAQPPSEFAYEQLPMLVEELRVEQLQVNRCTAQLELARAAEVSRGEAGMFSNRRRPGARFSNPISPAAPETPDPAQ